MSPKIGFFGSSPSPNKAGAKTEAKAGPQKSQDGDAFRLPSSVVSVIIDPSSASSSSSSSSPSPSGGGGGRKNPNGSARVAVAARVPRKRLDHDDPVRYTVRHFTFLDDGRRFTNLDALLTRLAPVGTVYVSCSESAEVSFTFTAGYVRPAPPTSVRSLAAHAFPSPPPSPSVPPLSSLPPPPSPSRKRRSPRRGDRRRDLRSERPGRPRTSWIKPRRW